MSEAKSGATSPHITPHSASLHAGYLLNPHPEEPGVALAKPGISKDEAEKGMAEMSQKFRAMGAQVYVDAEKVKESNKAL